MDEERRQVGTLLTGVGTLCFLFSIVFRCNRIGLFVANLLFFAGVLLILGRQNTQKLFTSQKHLTASGLLGGGFVLILLSHSVLGALAQCCGAFLMFGGFFPIVLQKTKRLPVVGHLVRHLRLPKIFYQMRHESDPDALPA